MATVGEIGINIVARTGKLRSGLKRGEKDVSLFQRTLGKLGIGALATGAAVTAAMWKMTRGVSAAMASVDADAKFAKRIGASVEAVQELGYAARLAGVQSTTLNMSLQRMTRRLAEAAQGGGEALKAIGELGLDASGLVGGGPEDAFLKIADALSQVESSADRVRLAFKFFDSEGVALLPMLSQGSAGIRAAMAQRRGMGGISTMDAEAIERANDAMTRVGTAGNALWQQLAAKLAPSIESIASQLSEMGRLAGPIAAIGKTIGEAGVLIVHAVQTVLAAAEFGYKAFRAIFQDIISNLAGWGGMLGTDPKAEQYAREAMIAQEVLRGMITFQGGAYGELRAAQQGKALANAFRAEMGMDPMPNEAKTARELSRFMAAGVSRQTQKVEDKSVVKAVTDLKTAMVNALGQQPGVVGVSNMPGTFAP